MAPRDGNDRRSTPRSQCSACHLFSFPFENIDREVTSVQTESRESYHLAGLPGAASSKEVRGATLRRSPVVAIVLRRRLTMRLDQCRPLHLWVRRFDLLQPYLKLPVRAKVVAEHHTVALFEWEIADRVLVGKRFPFYFGMHHVRGGAVQFPNDELKEMFAIELEGDRAVSIDSER